MIHYQKQKTDQCWPTAVAILTGVPVKDILAEVRQYTGVSYSIMLRTPRYRRDAVVAFKAIHLKYGIEPRLVAGQFPLGANDPAPDLSSRGLISVKWVGSGSHMVAFEYGLLYDSDVGNEHGQTWAEWVETAAREVDSFTIMLEGV